MGVAVVGAGVVGAEVGVGDGIELRRASNQTTVWLSVRITNAPARGHFCGHLFECVESLVSCETAHMLLVRTWKVPAWESELAMV